MEERINQLQNCKTYKESLRETCRSNKVTPTLLNGLTIPRLRLLYSRTQKHYKLNPEKAKHSWFENQLRLFHWALLIESHFMSLPLRQFREEQYTKIQTYFWAKSINLFEFELKKLLGADLSCYSKKWSSEECDLLCDIMEREQLGNRWNEVARLFYQGSGRRFFRTSKQCREQWLNHLDASKLHGDWTQEEDRTILQFVLEEGRKWARLGRLHLAYRTEHMIKNRFKSLLARARERLSLKGSSERKLVRKLLARYCAKAQRQGLRQGGVQQRSGQASQSQQQRSCFSQQQPSSLCQRGAEKEGERESGFQSGSSAQVGGSSGEQNKLQIIKLQEEEQQNQILWRKPLRAATLEPAQGFQPGRSPGTADSELGPFWVGQQMSGGGQGYLAYAGFCPSGWVVQGLPVYLWAREKWVEREM